MLARCWANPTRPIIRPGQCRITEAGKAEKPDKGKLLFRTVLT